MVQVTNLSMNQNMHDAVFAVVVVSRKETTMEIIAKAYLLFLTTILLATTINNAGELTDQQRRYALVGTGLAVLAVLVVW